MDIELNKVVKAARAGGDVVKRYFGEVMHTEEKTNAGDLRTKADTESEQAILAVLKSEFPSMNIYAEESGQVDNKSEYTFVVDPLDGTNNFVLGLPNFAISIGLLKDDEPILGVIYNPVLDQLFTTEKGKGAFFNGDRITVNTEDNIKHTTVSYTHGYNTAREYSDNMVSNLHDLEVKRILDSWAPAYDYCLLASGRLEAVINKEGDLEDYVAAKLLVVEAGGKLTNFDGQPVGGREPSFVATNGTTLHDQFLELIQGVS